MFNTYKTPNYTYGNVTVNASALPASGSVYVSNNTSSANWTVATNTTATPMTVNQSGRISLVGKDADLDINGVSLKETLTSIQEMLGVMKMDSALETEFEELRAAGERYRELRERFQEQKAVWDTLKREHFWPIMEKSVQYSMTTVTIEGADRAIDAGEWLNTQRIDYQIEMDNWLLDPPRYQFTFTDRKHATHFALRWR